MIDGRGDEQASERVVFLCQASGVRYSLLRIYLRYYSQQEVLLTGGTANTTRILLCARNRQ